MIIRDAAGAFALGRLLLAFRLRRRKSMDSPTVPGAVEYPHQMPNYRLRFSDNRSFCIDYKEDTLRTIDVARLSRGTSRDLFYLGNGSRCEHVGWLRELRLLSK